MLDGDHKSHEGRKGYHTRRIWARRTVIWATKKRISWRLTVAIRVLRKGSSRTNLVWTFLHVSFPILSRIYLVTLSHQLYQTLYVWATYVLPSQLDCEIGSGLVFLNKLVQLCYKDEPVCTQLSPIKLYSAMSLCCHNNNVCMLPYSN